MMKYFHALFLASVILFLPLSGALANEADALTQIARANDLYQKKQFSAASEIYQSLISSGYQNGYLYFNAGNTYFREGKPGQAILNYHKALKELPRDQNISANLNYAVMETADKILEPPKPFIKNILFWIDDFNIREYATALIAVNLFFWCSLLGRAFSGASFWNKAGFLTGATLAALLISAAGRTWTEINFKTAVVASPRVEVKSAADESNVTLFELHEGAVFKIGEERGDWVQVTLDDKKTGWVPKREIAPV